MKKATYTSEWQDQESRVRGKEMVLHLSAPNLTHCKSKARYVGKVSIEGKHNQ